ncbi:MAG TPA: hypothetical protein VHI31_04845, partial [Actinomycetota bacterium]|nr:hypothetical protein [Actinomycetota bacterium]
PDDEIPQLSSIFYDWREDSEQPRSTPNRIESTVVGLLSSVESWKKDILEAADQQEERLSDGMRSIQALITRTQMANSEVEQGIHQALAALWDKTAELGTGLEGWSAESRRLDEENAHTVRALEVLNARIAGLEESSEQRQEILTQHFGALVEALKGTLGEADKFSHQMQARVLRGLEAIDERIALRQQETQQAVFNELTALHKSTVATLEAEAARRTSEAAAHQARAHAEILAALEVTARQAAEVEAAAESRSRAGHTATQTVLEASLAGVSGAVQQLADSVQQLRADIRQTEGHTEALRAEVAEAAGQTQALREDLAEVAGRAGGVLEEMRQSAGQTEGRLVNHMESLDQRLMQALVELRAVSRDDQHNSQLELENRIHLGIAEPLKGIVRLMHTQLSEIQTTAQKTLDALRSVDAITRLERSASPADQRTQRKANIVELSSHSQAESGSPDG